MLIPSHPPSAKAKVLGKDGLGRWMVSVDGKRYRVKGSIDLAGRSEITINYSPKTPPAGASPAERVSAITKLMMKAFARSGLPMPEPAALAKLDRLSRPSASTKRRIRLAVLNADKSVKLTGAQLERLEKLFERTAFDNEPDRQKSDYHDPGQALPGALAERPEPDYHPLPIFNHAKGSRGTWIMIPFRYGSGRMKYSCVLTGRIPPGGTRIREASLSVEGAREAWGFSFTAGKAAAPLRIFGARDEADLRPKLDELLLKLRKLGMNIDDIYYKKDEFDGFPDCGAAQDYEPVDVTV